MENPGPSIPMFFELCRLCLKNSGEIFIFEVDCLADDIFILTGVRVSAGDNLPPKVCSKCQDILSNAKELRIMANNNDSHLHLLFDDGQTSENIHSGTTVTYSVIPDSPKTSDKQKKFGTVLKIKVRKDLFAVPPIDGGSDKCEPLQDEHRDRSIDRERSKNRDRSKHRDRSRNRDHDRERRKKKKKKEKKREHEKESERSDKYGTRDPGSTSKNQKPPEIKSSPPKKLKSEEFEDDEVFTCDKCDKVVKTWRRFYNHQRLHNKKFSCPFDACSKSFSTKGDLAKHVRTHTGEKPYLCPVCDKGFAQNVTLKGHMQAVHSDFVDS